jgi:methanethiol S-methyltransferase
MRFTFLPGVLLFMVTNHIVLFFLWVLYCVLHSVLASTGVKKWVQKNSGKAHRYYRLFYTIFAAVGLVALICFQLSLPSPNLYEPGLPVLIAGAFLLSAGLLIMVVCIHKYFLSLSGLKSLFRETPAHRLMVTGIHRYVRHPLYSGTFLTIWGFWLLFPSWGLLIAGVVITLYTLLAIAWEEEKLVAEFGEPYRQYQRTVPKLIPRF